MRTTVGVFRSRSDAERAYNSYVRPEFQTTRSSCLRPTPGKREQRHAFPKLRANNRAWSRRWERSLAEPLGLASERDWRLFLFWESDLCLRWAW